MKFRALLLCMLILLPACAVRTTSEAAPTPTPKPVAPALDKPTYTVQRGTIVDELKLSGHTAAIKQQDLSFTQDGHLKTLYVDRTSVITQGQLLAELDLGELPNQLRQAQVAYDQAQLSLERANSQRVFAQRRAQLDLDDARAKLAELQKPPKAANVAQARASVTQAQAALDETRSTASAAKTKAELALKQAAQALPPIQSAYSQALLKWQEVKDNQDDLRWTGYRDTFLRA